MIRAASNTLIIVSAVEAAVFVVLYHWSARWWESDAGRHVMAFMAVIAGVLGLSVLRIFLGDSTPFRIVRLAVFAGVPVVLGQRLWLLRRAQRPARRGGRRRHDDGMMSR